MTSENTGFKIAAPLADKIHSPEMKAFRQGAIQAGLTLRKQAEDIAEEKITISSETPPPLSAEEVQQSLHELQVHQIELEMQNEEMHQAQIELELARKRYFDLYDLAPVGYITVSEQGLLLEANFTAAALLGEDRVALVQQPISRFICNEDQDIYYLHHKQLVETNILQTCELRMVGIDETIFWAQLISNAVSEPDGTAVYRIVLKDISERKQAEAEILRNESRLRRLVNILQHPSETISDFLDYTLEQAIQLTESKIGYFYHYHENRQEFILNAWSKDVLPACAVAKPQTCYELTKTGIWGEAVRQRKPIVINDYRAAHPLKKGCPEGHVPLLKFMTVPIFKDEQIVGVIGLANKETDYDQADILQVSLLMEAVWNVAENMRTAEENVHLEAQLQQAQKMESIGQLAGGVAHDFNNMLGVILGHTEMALGQVDPTLPLYADLEEIRNAAERSTSITRQLLAFARKQTVMPKVLDLNETVEGMLKMLRRLIGEEITLVWQAGVGLWPVNIDPSQIDQILANLCVNARDAIAGVGKITVETRNSTIDLDYCANHPGALAGDYVQMTVSDNGAGISRETLIHIFEPFFTTKEVGKGTGLGLSTVYGTVKQNNGFINAYSEPGNGTAFTIYLPRYTGADGQARAGKVVEPPGRGDETVLLVEDELTILKMTTKMLQSLGYTVLAVDSPAEAIRLAGESAGKIQLLVTDVVMPEMNGRELAERLQVTHSKMKLLFMSGYTANIINNRGMLEPGVHFIQKPFSMHDLAAKIREALDSEEEELHAPAAR